MRRRPNFYTIAKLLAHLDVYRPDHIYIYDSQACIEVDRDLLTEILSEQQQSEKRTKSPVRLSIPHPGVAILTVIGSIRPYKKYKKRTYTRLWHFIFKQPIPPAANVKSKKKLKPRMRPRRAPGEVPAAAPPPISELTADPMQFASLFFWRLRLRRSEQMITVR